MHIINITVRDKIATHVGDAYYVCGNSDFVVRFDFDEEWAALDVKTARFIREDGAYHDQVFSGNECPVPIISNTNNVRVGVYAGNLCTTTPARVPAVKSILCPGGMPAAPGDDVYNQIMEEVNETRGTANGTARALQEACGEGGLYLIRRRDNGFADRTYDEINAAVTAGKTCILADHTGRVYLYSSRNESGKIIFRAQEHGVPVAGGDYTTLTERQMHINKDGEIESIAISPVNTPTPKKLTIEQNGETVEFDGRKAVNIKIEGGVPDPGKAHQQLVSDASGKAVWQDALAYKYVTTGMVDILKEDTLASMGDDDGDGTDDTFASATPLAAMPEAGKPYEVTINGLQYASRAYDVGDAAPGIVIGNPSKVDSSLEDTGEPYALCALSPDAQAGMGGATLLLVYAADSVTLSIRGEGTVTSTKKIDPELLPDYQNGVYPVNVQVDVVNNDYVFGACDKTWAQIAEAYEAGKLLHINLRIVTGASSGEAIARIEYAVRQDGVLTGLTMRFPTNMYANRYGSRFLTAGDNGEVAFVVPD